MVIVKICGITNVEDALKCEELGADFIGTIVDVPVETPRKIGIETAREIHDEITPPVTGVAVMMPESIEEALRIYDGVLPAFIQLHGSEGVMFLKELRSLVPCNIIKTIHVKGEDSIKEAVKFSKFTDAILLDTPSKEMGGTGKTHDWEISRKIVEAVQKPVILAGGLNPENVKEAVETVRPYGVDAASGVEKEPGKKDFDKVGRFVEGAKAGG